MSLIFKYFSILIIIYININEVVNVCTPGGNCPYFSGVCIADVCECQPGYVTLIASDSTDPKYCNYQQTSRWVPLILELLMPSLGLFYIRRIAHGVFKLLLFICTLIRKNIAKNCCILCSWGFLILYILDLIFLACGIYLDGNGIPLT